MLLAGNQHSSLWECYAWVSVCRNPLPPLFMRFTIQTLNAAPRLKAFVLDILSSLVNKQVHFLLADMLSKPCPVSVTSAA